MPRLFVGLEIPRNVRDDLAVIRGGLAQARWIEPDQYHLTLRFIGDVEAGLAREIDLTLAAVRPPSFTLLLDVLDCLGGDKPHSLVAKAQCSPALTELQTMIERRLQRLGLAAEPRKFVPHVSLARINGLSARTMAGYLAAHGLFRQRSFEVACFVLLSARSLTGGGPYVVEADYPLQRQPAARWAMAGR